MAERRLRTPLLWLLGLLLALAAVPVLRACGEDGERAVVDSTLCFPLPEMDRE